tara:strand:+ start:3806 stop:4162 length:357 start_codon:yes stop_codon:yes gene_type:complete
VPLAVKGEKFDEAVNIVTADTGEPVHCQKAKLVPLLKVAFDLSNELVPIVKVVNALLSLEICEPTPNRSIGVPETPPELVPTFLSCVIVAPPKKPELLVGDKLPVAESKPLFTVVVVT